MSKLDELVDNINADWWYDGQASYEEGVGEKQRIKDTVKTLFKELIGEDWEDPKYIGSEYDLGVRDGCNDCKKELRQKVDEL